MEPTSMRRTTIHPINEVYMRLPSSTTRRATLLVTTLLLAAAPSSALAAAVDGAASPDVTATLTPGILSVTPPAATLDFGTHSLTGAEDTVPIDLSSWSVKDATGDALGWSLKAKVGTLTDSGAGKTLAGAVVQFAAPADATSADQPATNGPVEATPGSGYVDLTADDAASGLPLATAAESMGMGTWTFPAAAGGLRLRVPSNAEVGSYTGTLTLTLSQTA
jgi:hypothetical protein